MAEDWKQNYKRALLNAFAKEARVVDKNASFYGWVDWERSKLTFEHFNACSVDVELTPMPEDSSWNQFQGTFYEGDTTIHGMATDVTCQCSIIDAVPMRLDGTFSELLEAVLRED